MKLFGLLLVSVTSIWGCTTPAGKTGPKGLPNEGKVEVVATTAMVADMVRQVLGERAQVTTLMGPGVDPHLYKASPGDISRLNSADLIVYNGLHLEGKMGDIFEKLAAKKPVVALAESLPRERLLETAAGVEDPHVWFDVKLWSETAAPLAKRLGTLDPKNAALYEANAARYSQELAALHEEVKTALAGIPRGQRVLVTAHDAFQYFGRAYDIEVKGIQGISTESEAGLREINGLVELLSRRKIPAVFVESSVSQKNIQALVEGSGRRGHRVQIGGSLFSDAMGAAGTPEGTYTGMVRHNVKTIVEALRR